MVNDVLLKLDDKGLTSIEALSEQLQAVANQSVSLELLRRGKPATLTVTPDKRASRLDAVHVITEPHLDVIWFAPQRLDGFALGQAPLGEQLNLTFTQATPDLAKQLADLEAQVKQLETSLAALRAAMGVAAQPAPGDAGQK